MKSKTSHEKGEQEMKKLNFMIAAFVAVLLLVSAGCVLTPYYGPGPRTMGPHFAGKHGYYNERGKWVQERESKHERDDNQEWWRHHGR